MPFGLCNRVSICAEDQPEGDLVSPRRVKEYRQEGRPKQWAWKYIMASEACKNRTLDGSAYEEDQLAGTLALPTKNRGRDIREIIN